MTDDRRPGPRLLGELERLIARYDWRDLHGAITRYFAEPISHAPASQRLGEGGSAKLPAFRLYDLRRTYASLLLAAGAPITYVSAQLGHANPSTTLRYYAKWIPSQGRRWEPERGQLRAPPPSPRRCDAGACDMGSAKYRVIAPWRSRQS